jgi:hypothetical protein
MELTLNTTFSVVLTRVHSHMAFLKRSLSRYILRATSHMRLRACDQYTSITLIGGKGRAGPSSLLHTTLEGPMEYISECKMDVKSTWIPTWHRMDHVSWSTWIIFQNHLLAGGLIQNWEIMAL